MENYSYVYILVDKTKKRFKIGLTKDMYKRYKSLKHVYGKFSLEDSYLIKCKKDYGKKLEKILHFIFSDFNENIDSSLEGYTEWFNISSLKNVIEIVFKIKSLNRNILEIKPLIQLIKEVEDFYEKDKNKSNKLKKSIKNLERKNLQNTIYFLKNLKMLLEYEIFVLEKDSTIIVKNIQLSKAKNISNNLFLTLFFENGGINIVESIRFRDNNLYIHFFNNDFYQEYKNKRELNKSFNLLNKSLNKYFGMKI